MAEEISRRASQYDSLLRASEQGAWKPVLTVLRSFSDVERRTWPAYWSLTARCLLDAGELGGAATSIQRHCQFQPQDGTGWLLAARIAAARGDAQQADAALNAARSSCGNNHEFNAAEILTRISFRRWTADAKTDGTLPPLDDVHRLLLLERNLQSLVRRQPQWAERIIEFRPWDRLLFADAGDAIVPFRKTGDAPTALFDPSAQIEREQATLRECEMKLSVMVPTLVIGVGTGAIPVELGQLPARQRKQMAQILVILSMETLAAAMMLQDWTQLLDSSALQLLDPEPDALETFFREDLRRVPKNYRFDAVCRAEGSEETDQIETQAFSVLCRLNEEADAKIDELQLYYVSDEFFARWQDSQIPKRILMQTCRYTTFVFGNTLHLAEAIRLAGHEATVLHEGDEQHHWLGPAYMQDQIAAARPDLFLRINFLRQECEFRTPPGMPYLTWVEDYSPTHAETTLADKLNPQDYATGLSTGLLTGVGFPRRRVLHSPVPSLAACYRSAKSAPAEIRFPVSYVSHQSQPPSVWKELFYRTDREPAEIEFVEELFAYLQNAADSGQIVSAVQEVFGDDWQYDHAPSPRPGWVLGDSIQLTNLFLRQTILQWISDAGYELALFGNGWEQHPTLHRHAKGPLAPGAELQEVFQSSAVNLQLIATSNVHQRLIDGLLSGGFFLMPRLAEPLSPMSGLPPATRRRLADVLSREEICTPQQLTARHPDLAQALALKSGYISEDANYYKLTNCVHAMYRDIRLWIPEVDEVMFDTRAELLTKLERWLSDAPGRRRFVDGISERKRLEPFTAEFLVARTLRWLERNIVTFGRLPLVPACVHIDDPDGEVSTAGADPKKMSGAIRVRCGNRPCFDGVYADGKPHGRFVIYHANGRIQQDGDVVDHRKVGEWKSWRADGSLETRFLYRTDGFILEFDYYFPDGSIYATGRSLGGESRKHMRWSPDGQLRCTSFFHNNLRHGIEAIFYDSGEKRSEKCYEHGRRVGTSNYWYRDGARRTQILSNARGDGWYRSWHPNGHMKAEVPLKRRRRDGILRRWDANGTLIAEINYHIGKIVVS